MRYAALVAASLALAGCVNLTGLDGDSKFSCKAPDGVTCTSLSGVYANVVANNIPSAQKAKAADQGEVTTNSRTQDTSMISGHPASSGEPIRSQQKVLRVWVAPWEDADGDLHDQSFIYVVAQEAGWQIEHNQRRIQERYRPTFLQGKPAQAPAPAASSNRQMQGAQPALSVPGNQMLPPFASAQDAEGAE